MIKVKKKGSRNPKARTQYQFSKALRIKAKKALEEKAGHSLSMDSIDLYLDRLIQLGMLFVKNVEQRRTKIEAKIQD